MAFHTSTTYARQEWAGNYNGPYHQLMDKTVDLGATIKMWEVGIQCRETRNDTGARQSLYIQILGRLTNGSWTTMSSFVTNTTDQWDRIFNWQVATGTEITAIRYIVKSQDSIARGHYGYANLWIAKWATNVAPSAPTSVTLHYNQTNDPSIPSTFPEDTSQIKIKWGAASDSDGDALKYKVERYINGALSSTLTSGTTSLSIVDSIGSGNQGNQYSYRVTAIDPDGASAYRNSSTVTKNRLSAPTGFAANGSFGFDTSNITFNWNLATNSNGDGNISYALDAEGLPVYNHKISSGTKSKTVTVWKSGNAPTDTFIDFNELKKIVEAYQWQGDVLFKLTATNNYGSSIVVSTRVKIDLRKAPPAPTNFRIENPTTISGVGTYYISGQSNPTLKWDQVYDYLGGSITYTIQQGSYGAVATNIAYPSAGVACRFPDLNSQQTITYTITAQTSFGMTSTASFNQVVHYLKQPSLSIVIQERTSTTVSFSYTAQINSSLPLKFSVFSWQNGVSGSLTNISIGDNKNPSGTATLSGLGEESSGSILFHAKDNSNLTTQTTDTKAYYAYVPILSVRKKGVGVNCINENSNFQFKVNGGTELLGPIKFGTNFKINTSAYNWTEGQLITTNIRKGSFTMVHGSITGNSYTSSLPPIDTKFQLYVYEETSAILAHSALHSGASLTIKAFFNSDNFLCFWWLQPSNYSTICTEITTSNGTSNVYFTQSRTAEPTVGTTMKITIKNYENVKSVDGTVVAKSFAVSQDNYGIPIEIGKYIDMHQVGSTADVDVRLEAYGAQAIRIQRGDDLSRYIEVGVGGTDRYIHNNTSGKYLQLKDNGLLDYTGDIGLNRLGILDTRGQNPAPSAFLNQQISLDFKTVTDIGNSAGPNRASWNNLLTLKGWTSDATGHPVSQLAFNGNVIDYRCSNGANAWNAWRRIPMLEERSGYWGLGIDRSDYTTYIRSPQQGFLPYTSNGGGVNSVLGTTTWQWHELHVRSLYLGSGSAEARIYYSGGNDIIIEDRALLPSTNGTRPLGWSNNRWSAVYASTGTIQTSDMRYKSNIIDIDDEIFFNMIKGTGIHSYVLNAERVDTGDPTVIPLTLDDASQENIQVGILAQELAQFEGSEYILCYDEESGYSVNNYNLTSAVMAALKAEITKRETLESEVAKLKNDMLAIEQVLISAGLAK